ncbi:hypothetical protein RIF29_09401 [Crotalaria pallida]|uniref:Uncharacterized protein n=1 Tax=Crotalaria pallida TaxID=3830 RepID=A0AAN9FZK1_CROPI
MELSINLLSYPSTHLPSPYSFSPLQSSNALYCCALPCSVEELEACASAAFAACSHSTTLVRQSLVIEILETVK